MMITMTQEQQERCLTLLYAVKQMFDKQLSSGYVMSMLDTTTTYDGTECDGYCLNGDINILLEEVTSIGGKG